MKIPTLANLLNLISIKYFQNFSCLSYVHNTLEQPFILSFPMITSNQLNFQNTLDKFNCQGFVIIGENVRDAFIAVERQLREVKKFRYTHRTYLLVAQESVDVEKFFAHPYFDHVKDVTLIVEDPPALIDADYFLGNGNRCFLFWRHVYVGHRVDEAVLVKKWCEEEDFDISIIFPAIKDAKGKNLVLSTFNFNPYVNIDTSRGAELMMVNSFATTYNFTIKLILEKDMWGKVTGNFTGTGAQYRTAIGESDISVGGFYGMEKRYFYNQFSIPTVRNGLVYIVPAAEPGRGFASPLRSFSLIGWSLIALVFIIIFSFNHILYLTYKRLGIIEDDLKIDDDEPFFNACGIILQQHVDIKFRMFGTFSLLFGVIFIAFYSSGLSSSMTKHIYKHQIKTGEQLEATFFDIIGYSSSYISSIEFDSRYKSIVKRFVVMNETELQAYMIKSKTFALALDHLDLGYSLGEYETVMTVKDLEQFRLLKEDLSYDFCVLLGYKHSVIFPLLNKHLYRLKESGLDYYWLTISFADMDYKIHMYFMSPMEFRSTLQLTWRNVEGAFGFWGIGLAISFIIFLYEKFKSVDNTKLLKNKNILRKRPPINQSNRKNRMSVLINKNRVRIIMLNNKQ